MACVFWKHPRGGAFKTFKTPMHAPSSTEIQENAPAEALTKPTKPRNQGEPMADADQWGAFEREVMEVAGIIRQAQAVKYADATPADVARDLDAVNKALTTALQVLGGLDLEHEQGQDLEARPYNWPTAVTLEHWGGDPTETIRALRKLREAARESLKAERPGRGNSADRREPSKRAASVGKNLVRLHRGAFGVWPPISKTGRVVDLLGEALTAAGVPEFDAADVLRRAVKTMRRACA